MDFVHRLETEMSIKILSCLDDPSDIVRASAVSRSWRYFVITNGLCKNLCLRMFRQLSLVDHVSESSKLSSSYNRRLAIGSSNRIESNSLEIEHRVYALLARGCTSFRVKDCISKAIYASSTGHFRASSILNTLEPSNRDGEAPSYWSSKGRGNPSVPETLTYKLVGNLCAITEINIRPFQGYFEPGEPIYSARYVRFRMGYLRFHFSDDDIVDMGPVPIDDMYVWTYTSPEFPMVQENRLQNFKLPEPVLCIGGYLQVELLGRVLRHERDGLFYICVSHVQAMGRSLSGNIGIENLRPSGKFVLKALPNTQPNSRKLEGRRMRSLDVLMEFGGMVNVAEGEWEDEDEDSDDEWFL